MQAKIEINLKPFRTPNYVLTEDNPPAPMAPPAQPAPMTPLTSRDECRDELPKYKLSELSVGTLNDLCEQFKQDIFKKAGKELPTQKIDK